MKLEERLPEVIRKSYSRKFATVALLILLIVAGIGGYTQAQVSEDVTNQQQRTLKMSAELEGEAALQWVETLKMTTRTLSEHRGLASGSSSEARATLTNEKERLPSEVVELHYLNYKNRTITASTAPSMEGRDITSTNVVWPFNKAYEEMSFDDPNKVIQTWVYTAESGSPSMAMVSRVPDTDYALVMVIEMSTRAEKFEASIEGTRTTIVGRQTGTVLLDKNESAILSQYSGSGASKVKQAILENENGTLLTEDSLVAFTPVGGASNWVVIKKAPKSSALVVRQEVQNNVFALIGVAIAGLLVLGGMVSRGPMRSFRELSEQATAIAEGNLDIDISDENRTDEVGQVRGAFRNIKGYLDVVADQANALSSQDFDNDVLEKDVPGRLGESLNRMQADLQGFISDIDQAREEAEEAQEEAEQLATSLEKQAEKFGKVMAKAAEGDLTQRMDSDTDNEAMSEIAHAFNEMITEIERTVVRIEEFAGDVDGSSEEISASAKEVRTASEEVSRTIQEIATGAEKQNDNIQQVTSEMTDLSATIEEITSSADEVAAKSQRAAETGATGLEYGEEAADEIEAIERKATETIRQVESLAEEMDRIGEVVTLIDEIADQTNMLALNASIEASRAGKAGEGFGVVASEIKTLAEETQDATDDIETMITEIQNLTDETVDDMREMGSRVDTGQETVADTTNALADIVEQVEEANTGVQSINDATDEQAASTEEVVAMVDEVGSISEQTSTQTENAAASAEEQTASISEVSENIRTLSSRATDLKELVTEFETAGDVESMDTSVYAGDDAQPEATDD